MRKVQKSIFEKIKKMKYIDGKSGIEEINNIYGIQETSIEKNLIATNKLCAAILKSYMMNLDSIEFDFKRNPLIKFYNIFMDKLNTLVKEEKIDENWLRILTEKLVFKSNLVNDVKLGLILTEKYLGVEKQQEVIETFSKSGEYIFYLVKSIKNISKGNSYIFNLLKVSKGTIKFFALTNLEILSDEINTYIIEEGYKDRIYEDIFIEYVLRTANLEAYLRKIGKDILKINRFSKLVYKHLNQYTLEESELKYFLILEYIPKALRGNNYLALSCIIKIWSRVCNVDEFQEIKELLEEDINKGLSTDKWKKIMLKELQKANYRIKDILLITFYYNVNLQFEDLEIYFRKNSKDFDGYLYLVTNGSEQDKIKTLDFFYNKIDVKNLLKSSEYEEDESGEIEENQVKIFKIMISGTSDLEQQGKEIALKGLLAKHIKVREEAIRTFRKYSKILTVEEKECVKYAFSIENNNELKSKLKELCEEFEPRIIEYVKVKGSRLSSHVKDIYLITANVSGMKYRDNGYLKEELKFTTIYNLLLEEDNQYDKNAIKIIGETGFVIGYISGEDNYILSNLIRGGRCLYGKINEYDLERNYVAIKIYLSYRDIAKEAEMLIQMMISDGGDFEN